MTMPVELPELPNELGAILASYGRSEYVDGSHNTEETLEAKERLFSEVGIAIRRQMQEYATKAVLAERYIIEMLVAAGHVSQEKVDKAREIAAAIRQGTSRGE